MEYCEENNLYCQVQIPENPPEVFVSGETRRNVFLTVKESLHNVVKHANATKVEIQFATNEVLYVSISDDGSGMKKESRFDGGNGLLNMKKRIEILGGKLNMKNGNGVTLEFEVPLA
jgi:signal transduction histidine kinase